VDAATRAVNAVGSDDDDDVAPVLDRSGWCDDRGQLLLHEPTDPSAAGHAPLSAASRAADPAGAGGPIGALFARVYGGAGDADVFPPGEGSAFTSHRRRGEEERAEGQVLP
jgi:hypothetical protein